MRTINLKLSPTTPTFKILVETSKESGVPMLFLARTLLNSAILNMKLSPPPPPPSPPPLQPPAKQQPKELKSQLDLNVLFRLSINWRKLEPKNKNEAKTLETLVSIGFIEYRNRNGSEYKISEEAFLD